MRSVLRTSMSLAAFVFLITMASVTLRAGDKLAESRQTVADGEQGVLLLRDSGVLSGIITRAADWYVLERNHGHIQIAQSRVLLVCRTLDEAYEYRRAEVVQDNPSEHLRLAEWCIRYELREAARQELAAARRLDPDLPRLALLERRLEKMESEPAVKESVYLAAAKTSSVQANNSSVTSSAAVTASAVDLSPRAVELFTRKVQPVLVNNCTTSGCHQPGGKESFQLDRSLLRGESNRRTTMHNLEATLALIDRAHPEISQLLTVPRRTHGRMSGPILGPRQEQAFRHLADWVELVAPPKEKAFTPAVAPVESRDGATPFDPAAASEAAKPSDGSSLDRRKLALHASDSASDDPSMTLRSPHRLQVGAQLKSWQPRDEFDPEVFNRVQRARVQENVLPLAPAAIPDKPAATDAAR